MTEIALLRHFPTDWNGEGRLQGKVDRPLTAEARAALAGLALPPPWDSRALLASPLGRALDTAEALARGRPVPTDPRLVEIAWGDWEGCRSVDLLADPASGFVPTGELGWEERPPGGESMSDGWARLRPLLAEIAEAGRPTLLVTHKGVMRIIFRIAAGVAAPEVKRARLYPLRLRPDGLPTLDGPALRLIPRTAR